MKLATKNGYVGWRTRLHDGTYRVAITKETEPGITRAAFRVARMSGGFVATEEAGSWIAITVHGKLLRDTCEAMFERMTTERLYPIQEAASP